MLMWLQAVVVWGYHSAVRGPGRSLHPSNEPGPQLAWGGIVAKGGDRPMQFRGGLGLTFGELNQPQANALTPLLITLNAAVIGTCLAGCSTTATVTQPLLVGHDTYTVSARMQGSTSSVREAALSAANQQCARLAKQLLVLKSSSNVDFNENKGDCIEQRRGRCDIPLSRSGRSRATQAKQPAYARSVIEEEAPLTDSLARATRQAPIRCERVPARLCPQEHHCYVRS